MEPIQFDWLGLHLQEPMAGVTNGLLAFFCVFAYFRLRKLNNEANFWWKRFFVVFGLSTFFGGLGHLFFHYTGMQGKIPSWSLGCLANAFAAMGMLEFTPFAQPNKSIRLVIWIKGAVLLLLALITQKFVFVAIDAILTYISFTGVYGWMLAKRGAAELKWMVAGVIILLPSAFIFLLKLNPHRWLNKDDLSHLLMLACIACFMVAMQKWGLRQEQHTQHG